LLGFPVIALCLIATFILLLAATLRWGIIDVAWAVTTWLLSAFAIVNFIGTFGEGITCPWPCQRRLTLKFLVKEFRSR
jgi:hypothetical protein